MSIHLLINTMKSTCHIATFSISSPLGPMEIVSCSMGLHELKFRKDIVDGNFSPNSGEEVKLLSDTCVDSGHNHVSKCIEWLQGYLKNSKCISRLDQPTICPFVLSEKDSFQEKVWKVLVESVHAGDCISYQGLAKMCNKENAARAVGQAMKKNPLVILIPCHRVIKSDGTLGQYAAGTRNNVKEWLLKHEGCTLQALNS